MKSGTDSAVEEKVGGEVVGAAAEAFRVAREGTAVALGELEGWEEHRAVAAALADVVGREEPEVD